MALSPEEVEIVNGLDGVLRPVALQHRERALGAGLPFVFISGRRSRTQQATEVARSDRTTPAAAVGQSLHELGAAYDLQRQQGDIEARVGALGEALGLEWGGRYLPQPDPNHFEVPVSRAAFATYQAITLGALAAAAGLGLLVLVKVKR
jgi:hypothetical protein